MRRTLAVAVYLLFLPFAFFLQVALAQNSLSVPTPDTAIGNSPLASYDVSAIDAVNPVNGNLFLQLPLLSFPQRGKSLRLNFKIYYNDKAWNIRYNPPNPNNPAASQGWGNWQMPVVQGVTVARDQNLTFWTNTSNDGANLSNGTGGQNVNTSYFSEFVTSPDGSQHYYLDQSQQTCSTYGSGIPCQETYNTPNNVYPATDGSGYTPVPSASGGLNIVDTSGVVYAPGLITDIDGNTIQTKATGWTDSVGRIIPGAATNPGLPYPTPGAGWGYSEDLVPGVETSPGNTTCPTGTKDARIWTVPVPGNTTASYYLCYNDFTYVSNFNLDGIFGNTNYQNVAESQSQTARLLTAIVLPNSTSYTFSYDSYLSLTRMTLPSGGSIAYTWQTVPFLVPYPPSPVGSNWPTSPVSRALSTRTVYPGNGEAPQVWSYHWYLNTASSGTVNYGKPSWSVVTDPYGNDTEHQLGGTDYNGNTPYTLVETATEVYTGCSPHDTASNRTCSSSTPTLMQSKAYGLTAMSSGGAQGYSASWFATYFPSWKPTTTVTTIPSAAGNLVTKTVITPAPNHGTCTVSSLGIMQGGGGTNPPPAITTSSNCFEYYQPQSVATYDYGVGAPGSLHSTVNTTYAWNSGTSSSASYLAANLLDLVSKKTTTNAAGSIAAESDLTYDESSYSPAGLHGDLTSLTKVNQQGASPTVHGFYNSNGEITKALDGNGGATSITAFQCGGSLPQTITNPLGQTSQYTFDCGTGVLTQYQDANDLASGRAGSTYSYDTIRNPILVTHPDGGSTTINYNSYAIPLTVKKTVLASPDPSVVSSTVYDGFLKPTQSILPNGATVETTYDLLGRVLTVANPHFAGTSVVTTSVYDSLGRTVQTVHPDGTSLWNCFNGLSTNQQQNCRSASGGIVGTWVDNADESGNDWQKLSDAEGELRQVVEPGSLPTTYTYDTLGNLQTVSQTGLSATEAARARSFTYNSLSQLLTSQNPETGTICYGQLSGANCINGYDGNGNLRYKTDARGIFTSYGYDALNRLISKTYSDATSSACFQYDASAQNGVGRLASEWTQPGSCPTSGGPPSSAITKRIITQYDAMGRLTVEQQCPWGGCSNTAAPTLQYGYDLAGDRISLTDSIGTAFKTNFDSAARLQSLTSSLSDGTHPATLFTATSYGPLGLLNSTLGNGLNEERSYDVRERIQSYTATKASSAQTVSVSTSDIDTVRNHEDGGNGLPQNGLLDVIGWAYDSVSCPLAQVEVYIDSVAIGLATVNGARPDMQKNLGGGAQFANCGYGFTGSIGALTPGTHTVTVAGYDFDGNRGTVSNAQTITVTANAPPTGSLDNAVSMQDKTQNVPSGGLIWVYGWAIDSQMRAPVGAVKVFVDGTPIGYATLGAQRSDIASEMNDQRYLPSGYNFIGTAGNLSVGSHNVTVTIYDTGGNAYTPSTVRQINVVADANSVTGSVSAQSSTGGLQTVPDSGSLTASGWVLEQNYPPCDTITRVEVWLDSIMVGVAQSGQPRQDVANAFNNQNCINSGWSYTGPVAGVDPGIHILTVRAYDHNGGSVVLQNAPTVIVSGHMPATSVTNAQPTQYAWSLGFEPNGNVGYSADSVNGNWAYLYDDLNRLSAAGSTYQNSLEWGYDSFGNLLSQTVTGGTGTSIQQSFNNNANRPDQGCYDAAGNQLEPWSCSANAHLYAYDADSRLISSDWGSNLYTYDAEGRRVAKFSTYINQPTAYYLYDTEGRDIVELDGSGNALRREIYAGGRHVATYDDQQHTTVFALSDWIGTERARSDMSGNLCQTTTSQPFGDNQQANGTCSPSNAFFTGHERDPESGNDYFGARYYASNMGRFMSPDWSAQAEPVPYAKLENPQSLNLYAFVGNNPLSRVDANGHDWLNRYLQENSVNAEMGQFLQNQATQAAQKPASQTQSIGSVARGTYESNTTAYLEANSSGAYPAGSPKCNKFVSDTVEDSGRPRPQVPRGIWGIFGLKRDPTAKEWANPSVIIPGWSGTMPLSAAEPGDVIAQQHGQNGGHSGILALSDNGGLLTVSVSSVTNPAGTVVMNNWGFRPGGGEGPGDPAPVVRRYVGTLP